MLKTALSCFVSFLHFLVLFWAAVAPFHKELQVSYVVLMPILMIHWVIMDDSCILTLLEKHIRGCSGDESYVHRFVSKIYNVPDGILGKLMWLYAIVTWIYAVSQVSWEDLQDNLFPWVK
ncbi:hypothetical protein ATCVCanal1_157R [Acanthocystis turfacea Chlorella virus Canal-1]|nr:hypothetical protein ATCVCanal1_157R [Acanthocystis turfacea Chlorella virus Canal-1]